MRVERIGGRGFAGVATVCLVGVLLACKQGDDAKESTPTQEADKPEVKKDPLELDAIQLDGDVVAAVKGATSCELDSSISYKCEAFKEAQNKLRELMKQPAKRPAILETLAALPFNEDAKLKGVAPYFIRASPNLGIYRQLAKEKGAVSEATGHRLLKTLATVDQQVAAGIADPVVKGATIAGVFEPTYAVIDGLKDPNTKRTATKSLMIFGRMATFEQIQKYAKTTEKSVRMGALEAPRSMYDWTDAEAQRICPWGEAFLHDDELGVAGAAAHLMVKCKHLDGGKYITAMLDEGKKRVEAGEWKKPFIWAYRDICFGGFIGTDKKAPGDLCDKTYEFLEWVANQEKVDGWNRGFALSMIYYQRRDQTTYDLLAKYKNSAVPEIKKFVEDDMKSLEENYLKKK